MEYKNPKVTVDGIVFEGENILLIKRKNQPFQGKWALPGGFVDYGETVENAVVREVLEETGLETKIERLVGVYSDPKRDPRGHTIGIAYTCRKVGGELKGNDDALEAKYFKLNELPELAFDHKKIIADAVALK
jgi:8-oxo-dGTP diphosphatase